MKGLPDPGHHDLVVVGGGPAGACAAMAALQADPALDVVIVDRAGFPRDKSCGDGIAPQVIDVLAELGCADEVVDGHTPVPWLSLQLRSRGVDRPMARPTFVIPREELDHRLIIAAQRAGATLLRRKVTDVRRGRDHLDLGDGVTGRIVIGADGVHSVLRQQSRQTEPRMAVALRGYAPTPERLRGTQTIVFGHERQPAYAWCFDRGDGLANVGYGELRPGAHSTPTKQQMIALLEELIPGTTADATAWRGAKLPLSDGGWRAGRGRLLLAGDAAGLVNPMTGEGIFYAVLTGMAAGRAASDALASGDPFSATARYRAQVEPLLHRHLRHVDVAARLCRSETVLTAGLRAAAGSQRVFDDLVELGLARGTITPHALTALARRLPQAAARSRRPLP